MGTLREVLLPDIGGFADIDVIEVLVQPGDSVEKEQSLLTLESDKSTMEIPSPWAGVVETVQVNVGDKVSEGAAVLTLEVGEQEQPVSAAEVPAQPPTPVARPTVAAAPPGPQVTPAPTRQAEGAIAVSTSSAPTAIEEVRVPDIGEFENVEVIEILAKVGHRVAKDDSLISLESDKATMEIPSPSEGVVTEVAVSVGEQVSRGALILLMKGVAGAATEQIIEDSEVVRTEPAEEETRPTDLERPPGEKLRAPPPVRQPASTSQGGKPHASPSVRRFARELGVDLYLVFGTGPKGRINQDDVRSFVKATMTSAPVPTPGAGAIPEIPVVDFSRFGEIEVRPLSRIRKIAGAHLHRSWLNVPHVTQHDEVEITDMEAFRKSMAQEADRKGVKLTPLVFLLKASAAALREYPEFNASLDAAGKNLILKKYVHIGIAVDTPNGLLVPVVRDVDQKGLFVLAAEVAVLAASARDGKLTPGEMQGGSFSISSLGGLGGTSFTPIVNAPEVAILGVSRAQMKPIYEDDTFRPGLVLPISLSYDHRVIDGAAAARFTSYLCALLGNLRRLLL